MSLPIALLGLIGHVRLELDARMTMPSYWLQLSQHTALNVAAIVVTVLVSLHFQIPYPQSHEFWTTFEDAVWDKLEKTDLSLSGHRVLDVCDWTNGCSTLRFCPDPRDLPEQQRDGDRLVSFCPFSVVSLLLLLLNKRDYFPSVHAN